MTGGAPLLVGVNRPLSGSKGLSIYFRNLVLHQLEVRVGGEHGVLAQVRKGVSAGTETVHQDESDFGAYGLAETDYLRVVLQWG